jgi:hypothetical protein
MFYIFINSVILTNLGSYQGNILDNGWFLLDGVDQYIDESQFDTYKKSNEELEIENNLNKASSPLESLGYFKTETSQPCYENISSNDKTDNSVTNEMNLLEVAIDNVVDPKKSF